MDRRRQYGMPWKWKAWKEDASWILCSEHEVDIYFTHFAQSMVGLTFDHPCSIWYVLEPKK